MTTLLILSAPCFPSCSTMCKRSIKSNGEGVSSPRLPLDATDRSQNVWQWILESERQGKHKPHRWGPPNAPHTWPYVGVHRILPITEVLIPTVLKASRSPTLLTPRRCPAAPILPGVGGASAAGLTSAATTRATRSFRTQPCPPCLRPTPWHSWRRPAAGWRRSPSHRSNGERRLRLPERFPA